MDRKCIKKSSAAGKRCHESFLGYSMAYDMSFRSDDADLCDFSLFDSTGVCIVRGADHCTLPHELELNIRRFVENDVRLVSLPKILHWYSQSLWET
jgi:hypothetical protein